uniref:Uncharacterized protein n=1 Tax=Chloropicon primus TaxID=1764295 RepID=A0A4D6C3Z8_9CHLO|nr:hypothetical protein [Chloropicon primus]QBX98476.1 hypothetical protein [Chloropicon primus]
MPSFFMDSRHIINVSINSKIMTSFVREYKTPNKNEKNKNRNFKPNKDLSNSRVKSRINFKKFFVFDEKKDSKSKNFSLLFGQSYSKEKDFPKFVNLSVLEGRLPSKFRKVLSPLYTIDEKLSFHEGSKDEFLKLSESVLNKCFSQKRFALILEKENLENLEEISKDPKIEKILREGYLRNLSFLGEERNESNGSGFIEGFFKIQSKKYLEKNQRIKSLRFKIESETKKSLPCILGILPKRVNQKGFSSLFYYKTESLII